MKNYQVNFGICNEVIIAQFLQAKGFGDQGESSVSLSDLMTIQLNIAEDDVKKGRVSLEAIAADLEQQSTANPVSKYRKAAVLSEEISLKFAIVDFLYDFRQKEIAERNAAMATASQLNEMLEVVDEAERQAEIDKIKAMTPEQRQAYKASLLK